MPGTITRREAVQISVFLKTHTTIESLATYIEKQNPTGIKVKETDPYLHLVVNKGIAPKTVKSLMRDYIDKITEDFPITIPKSIKLSVFEIYRSDKSWYVDLAENVYNREN